MKAVAVCILLSYSRFPELSKADLFSLKLDNPEAS